MQNNWMCVVWGKKAIKNVEIPLLIADKLDCLLWFLTIDLLMEYAGYLISFSANFVQFPIIYKPDLWSKSSDVRFT